MSHKLCRWCLETLPVERFDTRKGSRDGLQKYCIGCRLSLRKLPPFSDVQTTEHRRKIRRSNSIKRSYGITLKDYQDMFTEQLGLCKICRLPELKRRNGKLLPLSVDHDHNTGAVRGLLCCRCNHALGKMRDNPKILRRAAEYLEQATLRALDTPSLPAL